MYTCEYCGSMFKGRAGRPNKYCSHECHTAGSMTMVEKECEACHQPFVGYPNRKYCSLPCCHDNLRRPNKFSQSGEISLESVQVANVA